MKVKISQKNYKLMYQKMMKMAKLHSNLLPKKEKIGSVSKIPSLRLECLSTIIIYITSKLVSTFKRLCLFASSRIRVF